MTAVEARDCLNDLLTHLWNSQDRHTNGEVDQLIIALEEVVLPLINERIEVERIADRFCELGLPGPILTKDEIEYALRMKCVKGTDMIGKEIESN